MTRPTEDESKIEDEERRYKYKNGTTSRHTYKIGKCPKDDEIEIQDSMALNTTFLSMDEGMFPVAFSENSDGKVCFAFFPLFDRSGTPNIFETGKFSGELEHKGNYFERNNFGTFQWAQTRDVFASIREFMDHHKAPLHLVVKLGKDAKYLDPKIMQSSSSQSRS